MLTAAHLDGLQMVINACNQLIQHVIQVFFHLVLLNVLLVRQVTLLELLEFVLIHVQNSNFIMQHPRNAHLAVLVLTLTSLTVTVIHVMALLVFQTVTHVNGKKIFLLSIVITAMLQT